MKKRILLILALAFVVSLSGAAFAAKEGWPDQLRFMAGPPGGNWFALGGALADMWTKEVLQTTSSTGGGVANVVNTDNTRGDLGFSVTSFVGAAAKGEDPFKAPAKNAVVMSNLYTQFTYFIMRKDFAEKNEIKSLGDIVAKKLPIRFATLRPGTASEVTIRALFSKGYGVGWDDFRGWGGKVEFASYEDGANLLADNHLDIFAFSVGRVASIVMQIENQVDVVLLPVEQSALDALAEAYGTETFMIEPGIYKSVTEPTPTVGDYTCVVIRKDLPEDLVYELSKALWANRDSLAQAVKDISELEPKMALPAAVESHPGAVRFWNELKK
jgi:hypothetical protein